MQVVDSHHHLWDPATRTYPWMDDSVAPIRKRFGIDELRAVTTLSVAQTIVVQAVDAFDETQELLEIASQSDLVAGVVGWVDLGARDVAQTIARLREGPGGRHLVGIRHLVHDEPDPQWLLRDAVVRGLAAVANANLPYDLLVRSRELPAALALVRRLPQLQFMLDHGAKPEIALQRCEPWNAGVTSLAACPNVACKISGLVTEADRGAWRFDEIVPYVRRLVALFGPRRLLFGSDWPVCLLAASYAQVLDLAHATLCDLSPSELADVFAGNARRFYLGNCRALPDS